LDACGPTIQSFLDLFQQRLIAQPMTIGHGIEFQIVI